MRQFKKFKTPFQILPLLALLIIVSSCGGSATVEKNNITDAMKKTKDAVKNTAQEAKEMTKDAMDNVAETATDATDAMKEGAEKSMDKVKEMADKVEETTDNMVKETKEMASKAEETVSNKTKSMADKVKSTVSSSTSRPSATPVSSPKPTATTASTATSKPASTVVDKAKEEMKDKMPMKDKEVVKEEMPKPAKPAPAGVNHGDFDQLLRKHVSSSGAVDYAGFKNDKSKLEAYLNQLKQNPVQSNWSRDKQLVYWINAYNAFTIKLIVDNYPLGSITDLEGGKPWDKKWIKIGSKTYSLNNIENDIIRPQFKEPRIHFAVNCAAKSCPTLLNSAWTESNLERNFESQTKKFVNNTAFNKVSASSATLSKIFEWYGEDFGDLKSFINKYSNTKLDAKSNISFMDYNWKLNGK